MITNIEENVLYHLQICIHVGNVLNATWKQAEREVGSNSDNLRLWKIRKTAHFRFELLVNYVLHFEAVYITACPKIAVKTHWTVEKVTEIVTIKLN